MENKPNHNKTESNRSQPFSELALLTTQNRFGFAWKNDLTHFKFFEVYNDKSLLFSNKSNCSTNKTGVLLIHSTQENAILARIKLTLEINSNTIDKQYK